jgi:dihydrolipoamide dehydrogenase
MTDRFDIVVIGSGPGGYVAALEAARLGGRTALVEESPNLGGTCLNFGCIPSKALLASSHLLHEISEAKGLGVRVEGSATIDWAAVQKRKDSVLRRLRAGVKSLLEARGVVVLSGRGRLVGPGKVTVTDAKGAVAQIEASNAILAVGSEPVRLPGWPEDPSRVCTSDEALHWKDLPGNLLIVGGGVIGCEFACMMQAAGVKTTVVELMPEILPEMDESIGQTLRPIFAKRGIAFHLGTKVETLECNDAGCVARLSSGETVTADRVLVAVGRRPKTKDIGLETVGIAPSPRGFVPVDDRMQTSASGVYCIGDANGRCLLAHAASMHGVVAARNAMGQSASVDGVPIPGAVYTFPEAAGAGLTERQATEQGIPFAIGRFPIGHLGKAMAIDRTEGFAKVLRHRETGALLGVHMVGHNATECIALAVGLLHKKATVEEMGALAMAHPSISESLKEAAEDAFGAALHLPPKKAIRVVADAD